MHLWDLSAGKEFYISRTGADKVYNLYRQNIATIVDYQAVVPDDKTVECLDKLYAAVRKNYRDAEEANRLTGNVIRQVHYSRSIIAVNDGVMLKYVRAKLFLSLIGSNVSEQELLRYVEWEQAPERANEIITALQADTGFTQTLERLKTSYGKIEKLVEKLERLV